MVKWNAIRGTTKYIVYFKSVEESAWKTATTTNTSLPITGVKSGTNYYVQVRPIGSTVNGPFSAPKNIIHITTIKPTLKITPKGSGVLFEWNAFRDATAYRLYLKSENDSKWSSMTAYQTYYQIAGLENGKYYAQVQPIFDGNPGAYSPVVSFVYELKFPDLH